MGSLEIPTATSARELILAREEAPSFDAIPELRPRFRLSTLLMGITACAICLGVARSLPELAIAIVFVMAIAMIRVLYGIQLYANAGERLTFVREIAMFALSNLVVISIGGFVVCAFAMTLGACCGLGILIAHNADARQTEWIFGGFIAGWILGLVAASITGGWITRLIWFTNLGPAISQQSSI